MAYFREQFKTIFKVKDASHRIALAFSIGVFIGISPVIGLRYISAFSLAWFLRLNRLVAVSGVSVNNPWTIVPISTFCVWIGAKLAGIQHVLPEVDWRNLSLMSIVGKFIDIDGFIAMVYELLPLITAFFIGSLVVAAIAAVISYFLVEFFIARYKRVGDAT